MAFAPDSNRSRFWQHIQGRLVFLLLIVLIPTLCIQAYIYNERVTTVRAGEHQANLEIARAVSKTFDAFIQDILTQEAIVGLALNPPYPISLVDRNKILSQSRAKMGSIRNLSWLNPGGFIEASSNPEAIGTDLRDRQHIRTILAGKDWTVSNLMLTKVTTEPAFSISRVVKDERGQVLGIVSALILPAGLDEILSIERSKGGAVSLVDNAGMLVYRYPAINTTWEERDWLKQYPFFQEVFEGKEVTTTLYAVYEGKKRIVADTYVASIGWAAGAGRTEDEVMRPITSALQTQAMLFLLISLAAFGAALVLSRPISTSIRKLQAHAISLGHGESVGAIEVSGPAEIMELTDSFNSMSEELQRRELALRKSMDEIENLALFPQENPHPVLRISTAGRLVYANPSSDLLLQNLGWKIDEQVPEGWWRQIQEISECGPGREVEVDCGDLIYSLLVVPVTSAGYLNVYGRDITERKRMEREREITIDLLKIINQSTGTADLVRASAEFFQKQSGCEALGIRLKEGDDYPYSEARGFPREFVEMENSLCARDTTGNILRDGAGNPFIECMCGNVICGRTDPAKSFFTPGGSFWANNTTRLLSTSTDADRQTRTRNRCNGEGYESVALIPLRLGTEHLGLIQLNDRRKGMFSGGVIALWERLAAYLAVALARQRAEELLRKTHDELELRVHERTADLKTYMAKLEESNQALRDFTSIASHDLQEPLRKVSVFGDMLKREYGESLEAQGKDYLERMLNANQRMQSLLTALLEYSRLSTRADPFVEVQLTDVINEVLSDLEVRIRKTGGEVQVEELPVIQADPTQMRQLFQNLIGNGLKFHKEGEAPHVKVKCASSGNQTCQIEVEDNGIGFAEQYLGRIFAPFHRLHGKNSRYEGAGMGLAICKKIVERHYGNITAKSTPGLGSTFIVTLPVNYQARSR